MKISTFFSRLACITILVLSSVYLYSQAPYSFNYQGVARNDAGQALDTKLINIRVSLLQNSADGNIQFQEQQATTTSDRGLFAIRIGEGNAIIGSLSDIDWSMGSYFIRVEIDPEGGQNFINLGSSQLYSVPYALYALSSGSSAEGQGGSENGSTVWSDINGSAIYDKGGIISYRNNDQNQFVISSNDQGGSWNVNDENGAFSAFGFTFEDGAGFIGTTGPNFSTNIRMSIGSGRPNHGFLGIADEESRSKLGAYVSSTGTGSLFTEGPNGSLNTFITNLSGAPDNGYIAVYDSEDNAKAGLYVDAEGQGRIYADFVDSFVDNPEKSDEKIVYTMIRGPESATYLRGTSKMENGLASVDFPSHFSNQIDAENITVLITPLSADSKGIAVIKKSISGFAVKELLQGVGNYSFDWEVKGVRKTGNYKSHSIPKVGNQLKADRMSEESAEKETKNKMNIKKSE